MTQKAGAAADLLLVADERSLRRQLFDLLDGAGYQQLLSARGASHAAILVAGRQPPALIVVEFEIGSLGGHACCELFARDAQLAQVPILAVLGEDYPLASRPLPATVSDWLHVVQLDEELVKRCDLLLSRPVETPAGTGPGLLPVLSASFGFAFEEGAGEWLVINPRDSAMLALSPALIGHAGLSIESQLGQPWQRLLEMESWAQNALLSSRDRRWYAAQRRRAGGADRGKVNARPIDFAGRHALALQFLPERADQNAEAAVDLLAQLHREPVEVEALCERLRTALALDYVGLWVAPEPPESAPEQIFPPAEAGGDIPPAAGLALRKVLESLLSLEPLPAPDLACDPARASSDAGPSAPLHSSVLALPLLDESDTPLGALLLVRDPALDADGVIEPLLCVIQARLAQLLERRRGRRRSRAESLLDRLTGLPNRMLFRDRLDTIIREAQRSKECFAVLYADLDQFGSLNQEHGREQGDRVLQAVTQRLCSSVRASDTVARYEADGFTMVLRHIVQTDDVVRLAEQTLQSVEQPLQWGDGAELLLTASLGISFFPDQGRDGETLLQRAEQAMHAARALGGNNFQLYELPLLQPQQLDVALVSRLRQAQRNNELELVYQPQIDAKSEDIVGMEALLRWNHPDLGQINPGVFVPLAERSGLIVPIGKWVLQRACEQARAWELASGLRLRLGVNLSALQLMQPGLLDEVTGVLKDSGFDPRLLELEITESLSIKEAPHLLENLHGLHRLGCSIAIDDFGTGAASLDYLRHLPADRIKIDQSFVRNIGIDPDDESIVRATIEMAHRLNRSVVAEGVETEQHLQFLRDNLCDELQGYLFCRPLPVALFQRLLEQRQQRLTGPEQVRA